MGMMIPPTPPKLRKVRPELKPAPKKDRHTLVKSDMDFSNYLSNTVLLLLVLSGLYLLFIVVC